MAVGRRPFIGGRPMTSPGTTPTGLTRPPADRPNRNRSGKAGQTGPAGTPTPGVKIRTPSQTRSNVAWCIQVQPRPVSFYLGQFEFALAITDVARAGDLTAGENFIRRARADGHGLPIVVYTSNAARWRARLLTAGAQTVVDPPGDLIRGVDRLIPRHATPQDGLG